jgi:phage protein D
MSKSAIYTIAVNGTALSLSSILTGLTVILNTAGQADAAELTLDDSGGAVVMPQPGASISVSLGWRGEGNREVFVGTVTEVRATGSRSSGRALSISAQGFDALAGGKDQQRRSWDDATVKTILQDAGQTAGIMSVEVDPTLAPVIVDYWLMLDESFIAMGRRLAAEVGGQFRMRGDTAVMAKRAGAYTPTVLAAVGSTLHSWDIAPILSRDRCGKVKAKWFDKAASEWRIVEVNTGVKSDAVMTIREASATEAEARRRAEARAAAIKEATGGGSVRIEGDTGAVPDGLCAVVGARPGIDGSYRIRTVTHSYTRSGGFTTDLELVQPQSGAGEDSR